MIEFGAASGHLAKAGIVVVAILAAGALVAPGRRAGALTLLGALALAPVLLVGSIWRSPQLHAIHRHPLAAVAVGACAVGVVALLAVAIYRRPALFGLLAVVALPFRVPIESGGTTSNLLVPLYLVVAAGCLSHIAAVLGRPRADRAAVPERHSRADGADARGLERSGVRWLERLLALYVVLYAVQALYSSDFQKALQQMVFFYVPFALLYCLLRQRSWSWPRLRGCLAAEAGLAVVFALVGFVEYATKTVFLNPKLIATNNLHTYFTVNSVFFDPDIFGRFLAVVMVLLAATLLHSRRPRMQVQVTIVLALLWGGLVLTLSRSSLGALLLGLATLAALRWQSSRVILIATAVVALGAAVIAISPTTFGLNQGLNGASAGRAGLVSGGLDLFRQRPLWGYGSASFVNEYRRENQGTPTSLAASHTIAITVAAEQGVIGELVYLALVLVAVVTLLRGSRGDPARAAIAAAFLALTLHTELYADFLEDPLTWTLLGFGAALAVAAPRRGAAAVPARSPAPAVAIGAIAPGAAAARAAGPAGPR